MSKQKATPEQIEEAKALGIKFNDNIGSDTLQNKIDAAKSKIEKDTVVGDEPEVNPEDSEVTPTPEEVIPSTEDDENTPSEDEDKKGEDTPSEDDVPSDDKDGDTPPESEDDKKTITAGENYNQYVKEVISSKSTAEEKIEELLSSDKITPMLRRTLSVIKSHYVNVNKKNKDYDSIAAEQYNFLIQVITPLVKAGENYELFANNLSAINFVVNFEVKEGRLNAPFLLLGASTNWKQSDKEKKTLTNMSIFLLSLANPETREKELKSLGMNKLFDGTVFKEATVKNFKRFYLAS